MRTTEVGQIANPFHQGVYRGVGKTDSQAEVIIQSDKYHNPVVYGDMKFYSRDIKLNLNVSKKYQVKLTRVSEEPEEK